MYYSDNTIVSYSLNTINSKYERKVLKMSKQGKSTVTSFGQGGMNIHIPADIRKDSQNPLNVGDKVMVSIEGQRLIVERISNTAPVINTNE